LGTQEAAQSMVNLLCHRIWDYARACAWGAVQWQRKVF